MIRNAARWPAYFAALRKARSRWPRTMAALAVSLVSHLASAQSAFTIAGYKVLGNSLLSQEKISEATLPYVGPQSDFETIQKALESLERAYLAAGYGSIKVELPEQELEEGLVTLQVIEGVLRDISIASSGFYDDANVRNSLPALQPGLPILLMALNRNLVLANDTATKVSNVTFRRNANNRDVDAVVKVQAEDPQRWLAVLDNTGSDLNGNYRMGLVYQHANVWNRDHALVLQLMSSPGYWGQVRIIALGYRVPLYGLGDTLDFNASDSNVDSRGTVSGTDIAAVGKGQIAGLRYTHNLDPSAEWQHKLSAALETRRYGNSGNTGDSALSTMPLQLAYSGSWRTAQRDANWSATWQQNIPAGPQGWEADLQGQGGRAGARAAFQAWKFSAQLTQRFANQWTVRAGLSGQWTQDLLIAAEQFGIGGADSVRGFAEREAAGDQGLRLGLEVGLVPWESGALRLIPVFFTDAATARRNAPLAGEIASQTLASAGLGVRAVYGRHASARLDWGYVVRGLTGTADSAPNGSVRGDSRFHASLVWIF